MSSISPITAAGNQQPYTVATSTQQSSAAPSAPSTKTATTSTGLLDRDAFLKLLVAQLRYQDPSKPLDATEMVSQSAQLSVVDKLGEISSLLTDSSAIDRVTLAGSLIGKQISFTAPDGSTKTAIATAVSVAGASTVVRAGNVDVDITDITSITQPSAPSPNGQTT